jgi:CheY-like chemotaxis protein
VADILLIDDMAGVWRAVTDMLMPTLDGSEVLSQVKTIPNRPKVIAISGGSAGVSADMPLRAARASADAYLEKPFERTGLLAVVDRLLGKAA